MRNDRTAFTIVELLVVITIIVVLLALLAPALDQAIYQAEMAVCGTKQRGIGLAVTQYAGDFKRWYPHRLAVHEQTQWAMNVSHAAKPIYDDRPKLQRYMALNKSMTCPMLPTIDIEGSRADTHVFGTENYWFGFRYRVGGNPKGMIKTGDRLEYDDAGYAYRASVPLLVSTRLLKLTGTTVHASHPDDHNTYKVTKLQDETAESGGIAGARYTLARWDSPDPDGDALVDLNAAFADLSVKRYERVHWDPAKDERMARVPHRSGEAITATLWENVPKK